MAPPLFFSYCLTCSFFYLLYCQFFFLALLFYFSLLFFLPPPTFLCLSGLHHKRCVTSHCSILFCWETSRMLLTLLTQAFNLSFDLNFKIGLFITIILHLKKKNSGRYAERWKIKGSLTEIKWGKEWVTEMTEAEHLVTEKWCNSDVSFLEEVFDGMWRECVTSSWLKRHTNKSTRSRATHLDVGGATCSPVFPWRWSLRPSGPVWWGRRWFADLKVIISAHN